MSEQEYKKEQVLMPGQFLLGAASGRAEFIEPIRDQVLSGELVLSKFQQARLVDMVIEVIEMRTEMNSRFSEAADKLDELRDRMGKTASSIAEDFGEIIDYLENH